MHEHDDKVDEKPEEESFAELLEGSLVKPVRFSPGQKVSARVVKISSEWVFVDLGGKSEGYLDRKELLDEEGNLTVGEGDLVQAYFLSADQNELRLTTKISGGDAGRQYLEEAWRNEIPVEGLVEKEIKGGFEVKIAGGLRGFCPHSQMGLRRVGNPGDLISQHLPFRITQYDEKGRNIVLSNRAVLEEELQRQIEAQKGTMQEGMRVTGTITSIQSFGAFVKIGSVEGLIPISEISWDRVEDINSVLQVGQEVEVVAMNLDWDKNRLSFSLRKTLPDPWETVERDFPQGSSHSGTVVRLAAFGAFVALAPGVDGLLHISKLGTGKRINHPREVVAQGQVVDVKIENVDRANKRISLAMAGSETSENAEEAGEDYKKFLGKHQGGMGTLADLLKAGPSGKKK